MSYRFESATAARLLAAAISLAAGGCATNYHLTLMPRDSGKIYEGLAENTGEREGPIRITIEGRAYAGTWVEVVSDRTSGYVSGTYATGRHGYGLGWGLGGSVWMDNPAGGQAKALLRSPDGAGLRCDLRGGSGRAGGGLCLDDKGLAYDVQIRPVERK